MNIVVYAGAVIKEPEKCEINGIECYKLTVMQNGKISVLIALNNLMQVVEENIKIGTRIQVKGSLVNGYVEIEVLEHLRVKTSNKALDWDYATPYYLIRNKKKN